MIVYGTKISSDIYFPLDLPETSEYRCEVTLSAEVPGELKASITCGIPLYWAHGRHVYFYSDRVFEGSENDQPWCYEVKDVVTFYWRGGKRDIFYEFGEKGSSELLAFWCIHLFLPLYLTLEGIYEFLHAGAVEVDGKPILFIAPSMGGKSTMTDYFIRQGHVLVSDDKVPTYVSENRFIAYGSHPYHRPYRKFEELGYRVRDFAEKAKPIHAFYLLEKTGTDDRVDITEVRGFAKFESLLPNYLYMFSWLKPKRFKYLSQMLDDVRVFHVKVPWDLDRLGDVYDAICKHSEEMA